MSKEPFTDLGLRQLNIKKRLDAQRKGLAQMYIWDAGSDARLGLLISRGGTKTFRTTYKVNGQIKSQTLGRFPALSLADARRLAEQYKEAAERGVDFSKSQSDLDSKVGTVPTLSTLTFGRTVDLFIENYAKPRQRTWDQTACILKGAKELWGDKPIASITKGEVYALLDDLRRRERPAMAAITLRWLKTLWRWAWKRDYVSQPIMDAVDFDHANKVRERVYSDDEIRSIWNAANKLDPEEGAYVKLLVLLAPRKSALALMRWKDVNDDLWVTPHELTKSKKTAGKKRVYLTPLPPLAQRILKRVPRRKDGLVFPSLRTHHTRSGQRYLDDSKLLRTLIRNGAPEDLHFHTLRHTLATYLQNVGHSEWEVGLILNHSSSNVTAGYSHGYPVELKKSLLLKWSSHVEELVQPEGARVLR
jgi:integrase